MLIDQDHGEATGPRLLNPWTWGAVGLTLVPLILWGAASVFLLAVACGIPAYLAWVPSASTTGVMLLSSMFAMKEELSANIRAYAQRLAYFGIGLDTVVAGLHLALPIKISPAIEWLLLIGMLPPLMGGVAWHMVCTAIRELRATRAATIANLHAAELARQARVAEVEQAHRDRIAAAELAERTRLAAVAQREVDAANERRRVAAQATVSAALTGPTLVRTPARKPTRATKPTLRDAAIAELVTRHRAGVDITTTVALELDGVIGASRGYCKKFLTEIVEHVLTAERGVA